jgi:uncharacterized protein
MRTSRDMTEADIQALERYISSGRGPIKGMNLSKLDGFLNGLIVGPEVAAPDSWMEFIIGHKLSDLTPEDFFTIAGSLAFLYNAISDRRSLIPPQVVPYLYLDENNRPLVVDWCQGFIEAVKCGQELWEPLLKRTDSVPGFPALIALGCTADDYRLLCGDMEQPTGSALEALAEWAPSNIENVVNGIRAFWRAKRAAERSKGTVH